MPRKPSLSKSPVLKEAERKVKEKKAAKKVKKAPARKKTAKIKVAKKKKGKDPMWKHLAAALKKLEN